MRIKLLTGIDPEGFGIATATADLLKEELEKDSSNVICKDDPDIIHILGGWDGTTTSVAKDAMKKHIAIIHTPLGALSPWYKPTRAKFNLSSHMSVLVASGEMEKEMLDDGSRQNLRLILNAVTTKSISASSMTELYKNLYVEAMKQTDENLWKVVKDKITLLNEPDEVISTLCERILYAQYLYQRRNIPLTYIKELSTLFIKSNYDEDHLVDVLKLIRLNTFTQHLEYAMMEKANLTEGFMPVIWKEDKTSHDILKCLTDY